MHDFRQELLKFLKRIFFKSILENFCRIAVFFLRQRTLQERTALFRKLMNQPFSTLFSKAPPCPNKRPQRLVKVKYNGRIFRNPGFLLYGVLHDEMEPFFGSDQVMELEKYVHQRKCRMLVAAGPETGFEVFVFFHGRVCACSLVSLMLSIANLVKKYVTTHICVVE